MITALIVFFLFIAFFPFFNPTQRTQTSLRRLQDDQTRRRHDVWKKTSDLRRLEDV